MTSTLTYLCTFKKGALKTTFKFERTPKGLVCNATEIHIQETGADKIRLNSKGGGGSAEYHK